MSRPRIVVVSYIPLLRAEPGEVVTLDSRRFRDLADAIGAAPAAQACLWACLDEGATPVLAVERSHEVLEHLIEWSEGRPEDWFCLYLHVDRVRRRYHALLVPNLARSVERYRRARLLLSGEVVPEDSEWVLLFKPLAFSSRDLGTIMQVPIREEMRLGFLDARDFDPHHPGSVPDPIYLGPFRVNPPEQPLDEYLGELGAP